MISSSKESVIEILKQQRKYFESRETRDVNFRIRQLKRLKKGIKDNEKIILDSLFKDLNKSEFEAYATEVGYVYDSINYFIKNIKKWSKVKRVKTPLVHFGSKSYVYAEPYGVALIIGAFNYPFQLVLEPLIGAIAAGNCAILKPSEFTPNVSKVLNKLIKEIFDEKYVAVIEGEKEVTSLLINSPFDYIFFTGSAKVGKIVMEAAAKTLVPITLELGGKSPCIVDKNANIKVAAQRIVWGKFINAGQTCVAPDYIIAHKEIKKNLIDEMIKTIKVFYGDNPKLSKDYVRIINEKQVEKLVGLISESKVAIGGEYSIEERYMAPTIIDNVSWDDRVMEDEIFGPILPVIEYGDLESVIKTINSRAKPLALYVFTESKAVEKIVIENVSYGGGCVNDTMTHVASAFLPFGGVGSSGLGAYHGEKSFETFSHMKSVLKKSTKVNLSFIFPPYTKQKVKLLRSIMK